MDEIQALKGKQILPYLDAFGEMRTTVFREYPYLYESDSGNEKTYLGNYAKSDESLFIIAKKQGQLIGCLSSIPFLHVSHESWAKILQNYLPIDTVFYLGDMLVLKEYRGQRVGTKMYDLFEDQVKKQKKFSKIAFLEVVRPKNDPKRPKGYKSLDPFWEKRGYVKHPEFINHIPYREIGDSTETDHTFLFQTKDI